MYSHTVRARVLAQLWTAKDTQNVRKSTRIHLLIYLQVVHLALLQVSSRVRAIGSHLLFYPLVVPTEVVRRLIRSRLPYQVPY